MKRSLVAASRALGRCFGAHPGETLSAFAGRTNPRLSLLIDWLLLSPGHCARAHERHNQMNEPKQIALGFQQSQVDLILKGLSKLPIEEALTLFLAIQQEAKRQAQEHANGPQ